MLRARRKKRRWLATIRLDLSKLAIPILKKEQKKKA